MLEYGGITLTRIFLKFIIYSFFSEYINDSMNFPFFILSWLHLSLIYLKNYRTESDLLSVRGLFQGLMKSESLFKNLFYTKASQNYKPIGQNLLRLKTHE